MVGKCRKAEIRDRERDARGQIQSQQVNKEREGADQVRQEIITKRSVDARITNPGRRVALQEKKDGLMAVLAEGDVAVRG